MTDAELLDALADIALAAGDAVMAVYHSDFAVDVKADASPVTRADVEAEKIILAGLARVAPEIPVIAEEAQAAGVATTIGSRFFLVDPLDGTKEFVSRNGEFTVNIALVEDGVPVMGVVLAPVLGRLWLGGRGLGARLVTLGESREISVRKAPSGGLCAIGSRSHGSAETTAWLQRFDVASFVAAGSSLKLCLVASGEADIYPRLGRTMEWDIAAGDAILRAAGGIVTCLDGTPFVYGKRSRNDDVDFANPPFVAWGDAALLTRSEDDGKAAAVEP